MHSPLAPSPLTLPPLSRYPSFQVSLLLVASLALLSLVAGRVLTAGEAGDLARQRLAFEVNSNPNAMWKARVNKRFAGQPIDAIKRQLGGQKTKMRRRL